MANNEMMNLNLTRRDVCDILRAITSVRIDFRNEIRDENISEDRREIAKSSVEMWDRLHEEIKKQLTAFDDAK